MNAVEIIRWLWGHQAELFAALVVVAVLAVVDAVLKPGA